MPGSEGSHIPWTAKQQRVAQAVKHGWKPKGKAKGFTPKFAEEVVEESKTMPTKPPVKMKKGKRASLKAQMKGMA